MTMTNHFTIRLALTLLLCAAVGFGLSGCMKKIKERRGPDMQLRMLNAPPIRIDRTEEVHLLIMQAPNPGWTFSIDTSEKTAEGTRLFVTIRRPDPTMLQPQMIVEKQLRTLVHSDVQIELLGRLLDFKETTDYRRYAPIEPVESFEE